MLTLMGASGLVPNGIPLVVQPEDAGRWWLEGVKGMSGEVWRQAAGAAVGDRWGGRRGGR